MNGENAAAALQDSPLLAALRNQLDILLLTLERPVVQRQIGMITAPLIVIDVAGCYAPLRLQLERAAADGLLYGPPHQLLTLVPDAAAAVACLAG